jgi:hypothetical protein
MDAQTVSSQREVVLLSSQSVIEDPTAALGTARVEVTGTSPVTYALVYQAPQVVNDTDVVVNYKLDGEDRSVKVLVTSLPQPPTLQGQDTYEESFKALFVLFIIAVIIESGLSVVFNWRPFIQFFDARGVKTILAFAFSYFFVEWFDLDIATRLVNLYSGTAKAVNLPGKFITALVLAGGSGAVNNLLTTLGFRSLLRPQQITPRPEKTEAWISVLLERRKAVGPVHVQITPEGEPPMIAGTINGTSKGHRGFRYFLRDSGRFPTTGGYSVTPGKEYTITLVGRDEEHADLSAPESGPHRFAPGAIVDLKIEL